MTVLNFIICIGLFIYIILISDKNWSDKYASEFLKDIISNNIFRVIFIFFIVGISIGYEVVGVNCCYILAILLSISYIITVKYINYNKVEVSEKFLNNNIQFRNGNKKLTKSPRCGPYEKLNSKFNPSPNEPCNSLLSLNTLHNSSISGPLSTSQTACQLNMR